MGDFNQFYWLEKNKALIKEPILEIGSKFYNDKTSIKYRDLCQGLTYVGVDMSSGLNVDKVVDLTTSIHQVKASLGEGYQTIICCSVMEHVKDIFTFSRNVSELLSPGGVLFLSVPFTWEFHGYPNDYWRFTPPAIEFLFPEFDFNVYENSISSSQDGDIKKLSSMEDINEFLLKENEYWKVENSFNGPFRWLKKLSMLFQNKDFRKQFLLRKYLHPEYRLALSCINMIGIKK